MTASVSRPFSTARMTSSWPGRNASTPKTRCMVRLRSRIEIGMCVNGSGNACAATLTLDRLAARQHGERAVQLQRFSVGNFLQFDSQVRNLVRMIAGHRLPIRRPDLLVG